MTFRIGGNGDPFNQNNLGKQHDVQNEAAVVPKETVPVGKSFDVKPEHIDLKDLKGLESLGYQNMGLHIRKPKDQIEELAVFAQNFSVANVPQSVRNDAMAIVSNTDIRFGENVNRQRLMMAMARETVPEDSQARIEQSIKQFEGLA